MIPSSKVQWLDRRFTNIRFVAISYAFSVLIVVQLAWSCPLSTVISMTVTKIKAVSALVRAKLDSYSSRLGSGQPNTDGHLRPQISTSPAVVSLLVQAGGLPRLPCILCLSCADCTSDMAMLRRRASRLRLVVHKVACLLEVLSPCGNTVDSWGSCNIH